MGSTHSSTRVCISSRLAVKNTWENLVPEGVHVPDSPGNMDRDFVIAGVGPLRLL
jgi:hypothetical protein